MDDLFDFFSDLHKRMVDIHELEAIWLDNPLQTSTERTVRITTGHEVLVKDGKLVDCVGSPSHKVIGCLGNVANTYLSFLLTDLATNEPLEIRIQ